MKSVFFLPVLFVSRLLLQGATFVLIGLLCGWFSFLMLAATPFWVFELVTAPTWRFVRVVPFAECESYLDWMFSRTASRTPDDQWQFVRMWGLEFRYTEWPETTRY